MKYLIINHCNKLNKILSKISGVVLFVFFLCHQGNQEIKFSKNMKKNLEVKLLKPAEIEHLIMRYYLKNQSIFTSRKSDYR